MSFLQIGFLGALAALAIPVIIHLVFRQRSKRVDLGTLRFLRVVLQQNARRRRVMRWLLLTLRLAFQWHVTILIVWLVMPVLRARCNSEEMVRGARLLVLSSAAFIMFRNSMWPFWIELLWRAPPSGPFG